MVGERGVEGLAERRYRHAVGGTGTEARHAGVVTVAEQVEVASIGFNTDRAG